MRNGCVALGLLMSVVLAQGEDPTTRPGEKPDVEVTVTAKSRGGELLDQPRRVQPSLEISQSIIHVDEMERQGARVLTEAVRYLPGTWTETRGRKVKEFVSYRGQIYPYPDFAWNGLWLPEFHEMPYLVPASSLESVSVLRSGASLFMGVSGDTGVIDLTPRAPEGPVRMMVRGASHETAEFSLFAPLSSDPGGLAFGGGYFQTEGPDGRHAEENFLHAMVSGAWQPDPSSALSLQVLALRSDRELMNALPPAGRRLQDTQERYEPFQALLTGVRLDLKHADEATTSLGFGGAYRNNDFVNEGTEGHISMREEDYSLTFDLTHVRLLSKANRLRTGVVYNHFAAPEGKRFIEGRRVDYDTTALILADEHQWGPVLLDGGIRVSRRYFRDYAGFSLNGSSAGFEDVESIRHEWDKPRWRLTAGAQWFMVPGVTLFAHAGHDRVEPRAGTLDVELEEPDVETRINGELGLRHTTSGGALWEITGFAVQRNDGLLLDGSTAITPAGRELELYRNQDLRQYGAEAGVRHLPVVAGVTAFANVTCVRSEAEDSAGEYIRYADIPVWIGAAGLDAEYGPWGLGFYLKTVSGYESRRFSADGEPKPLGDFTDMQARLSRKIAENIRVTFSVENILNEEYSTVVGYPDIGRRYGVQMDMTW